MSAYISIALQQKIRQQFGNCCAYCHTSEALTATTFEFEHILPMSAGGTTTAENLCLACPTCNRHKAARQSFSDPQTNTSVLLFHPQQQVWDEHFSWNQDSSEILPQTSAGRATCKALRMNRPQLIRVRKMWVLLDEHPPKI